MELNNLFKQLLENAIELFGPMNNDWFLKGVEVNKNGPCLLYYPTEGEISISLSRKVINNDLQLKFQLAHEICHLLYPALDKNTLTYDVINNLNEGISTYFSFKSINKSLHFNKIIEDFKKNEIKYFNAMENVDKLLLYDENIIKKVRLVEPKVNRLTKEDFLNENCNISNELLSFLLKPFK